MINIDHELAYERSFGVMGADEYCEHLLATGQLKEYIAACKDAGIVNKYTQEDKWDQD